jgi:dTMP kinase
MFVTIEGIDNVGKTTICNILKRRLSRSYPVRVVSDPTRVPPWASSRHILLGDKRITPTARAMMLLAARIDAYERVIKPALRKGELVLGDRFTDSWLAYQAVMTMGHFRTATNAIRFLKSLNELCMKHRLIGSPDKTFLITADPVETIKRGRGKRPSLFDSIRVQKNVHRNYLRLAKEAGTKIEVIDSRGRSINEVALSLESKIRTFLGRRQI